MKLARNLQIAPEEFAEMHQKFKIIITFAQGHCFSRLRMCWDRLSVLLIME